MKRKKNLNGSDEAAHRPVSKGHTEHQYPVWAPSALALDVAQPEHVVGLIAIVLLSHSVALCIWGPAEGTAVGPTPEGSCLPWTCGGSLSGTFQCF